MTTRRDFLSRTLGGSSLLAFGGVVPEFLANAAAAGECQVFYWRERSREVDFVVRAGRKVAAIEVKTNRRREALPGLATFLQVEPAARPVLIGADGISIEQALVQPINAWL